MSPADQERLRQVLEARRDQIASEWQLALATTTFVPLSALAARARFQQLADQVIAVLLAEPFAPRVGRAIGAQLAGLHYLQPDSLSRTQTALVAAMLAGVSAGQAGELHRRLSGFLAEFSAGFFAEARSAILGEQESIREALVSERRRAHETIAQLNADLERRVRDRTAELTATNARLAAEVSERTQAEAALRSSEERYRRLVDNSPEPIIVHTNGRLVFVNPAAAALVGASSPTALLGRSIMEFVAPEYRGVVEVRARLAQQEGQVAPLREEQFVRLDGRRIDVEVVALPITYRDQPSVQVVIRDVTERKRGERAQHYLAQASATLASSLDYTTTVQAVARLIVPELADWCTVDILDDDGNVQALAVVHVDPSKEVFARELREQYPPLPAGPGPGSLALRSGRAVLFAGMDEQALQASTVDAEHLRLLRRLDPHSAIGVPLIARGRTLGTLTLSRGSASPNYEQRDLLLAEELAHRCALAIDNARLYRGAQEAVREREAFLSVAAHELKTPVTSLRGFAQLALRALSRPGAQDSERTARALLRIDQQARKLARLVELLLEASRLDIGRLRLDYASVDAVQLVTAAAQAAQEQTTRHTLSVSGPPAAPLQADPLRLEQVITNLLDNAIKYSPGGGAIDARVALAPPDAVEISVRDHGLGIPVEHRKGIFERFYRAHEHAHLAGLGIGLYLSRQITELHGGSIAAEFPPDGGTRIILRLPQRPDGAA